MNTQALSFVPLARALAPVALAVIAATANASEPPAAIDDCEGGSQVEMNACAHERLEQSESAMRRLYERERARLAGDSAARLAASQRLWESYRDSACLAALGAPEEGGSIWPLVESGCRQALTQQRIEVLSSYRP
jgi:uncharacterized protein YecT (DUF1311 family)